MLNKFYMLFRNKKIYIKMNGFNDILEYEVILKNEYPNIPFYIDIFNDGTTVGDLKQLVKTNFGGIGGTINKFVKPVVFVLLPDDTFGFEKKALEEFPSVIFPPRKVFLGSESLFISPDEDSYICISKSNRMMVYTYISNNRINKQIYVENKNYTLDEVKGFINGLQNDYSSYGGRVYLNGEELEKYSSLGTIVGKYTLIKNYEETLVKNSNIIKTIV